MGLPLLLAGGVLWLAMQHQDSAGGYRAALTPIRGHGYAVVASDVDALLRKEAPFARGGRTSLRLTASTDHGPAFLGLAPARDVARYLAGVPYLQVNQVRIARGPLPVAAVPVTGVAGPPALPAEQSFWLPGSGVGTLEWRPYEHRGEQLALVVMDPAARTPLRVDVTAHLQPEWIGTTTVGLLVLGSILVLIAIAALAWPARSREIIYVVPQTQVPELAAQLGLSVPTEPIPAMAGSVPVEQRTPGQREPEAATKPVTAVPATTVAASAAPGPAAPASASASPEPADAAPAPPDPAGSVPDTFDPGPADTVELALATPEPVSAAPVSAAPVSATPVSSAPAAGDGRQRPSPPDLEWPPRTPLR
ncbi:MAG TPA: hypothetical protein VIL37_00990 [Natronosporangium sp.]